MKIHPDVLAAHAQFGGDLEMMQKCYEWPDLKARIAALERERDELKAALEPEGWQLVPKEATAEMILAGFEAIFSENPDGYQRELMAKEYVAMLAAAPRRALSSGRDEG